MTTIFNMHLHPLSWT